MVQSLPRLNRRTDWQAVLGSVLPSGEAADHVSARPSHRAMPAASVAEKSSRRRVQAPEAALVQQALTKTNASDGPRARSAHEAAFGAAAHPGDSTAATQPRDRARRMRSGAPLPVAIVDASALADVLKIYAPTRGFTVAASPRRDHAPPRPAPSPRGIELPNARREWPYRAARRAARRLIDSRPVASVDARNLQTIENEVAVALVQTLDMGVEGMRIEPVALPDTMTPAGSTLSPIPEPGSSPFAPLERPPLSNPAAVAPSAVADPLHPIGFSSAVSAPAPDVPVSAIEPAGRLNQSCRASIGCAITATLDPDVRSLSRPLSASRPRQCGRRRVPRTPTLLMRMRQSWPAGSVASCATKPAATASACSETPMRPMLDDLELVLVQEVSTFDKRMLAEHKPPGMDGSVLQNLGRRATCIVLWGVALGENSRMFMEKLDTKFKAGQPLPFVADITEDMEIENVLIDDLRFQELAGKTDRFAYVLTLREHQVPVEPEDVSFVDTDVLGEALDQIEGLVEGLDAAAAFAEGLSRFVPQLGELLGRLEATRNTL